VLVSIGSGDEVKASIACPLGKGIKVLDKRGIGYSNTGVIVFTTPLFGLGIHGNFAVKRVRIEGEVCQRANILERRVLKHYTICQGDRRTAWSRERGGLGGGRIVAVECKRQKIRVQRAYHELKSSSLSSCNGSRLCLSGVGVMGEDVEMDIDRRFQLRALRKVAGSEEPGPRGVLRDNVEDRRGGDQGISIKR